MLTDSLWFQDKEEHDVPPLQDTLFTEVILPFSLPKTFTYRVPREWNDLIHPGQRVVVPFGKKKLYAGIVYKKLFQAPKEYEARYLHSILDEIPLIDQIHLDFWTWMASYYLCNLGDVMSAALPSGLKLASETMLVPAPEWQLEEVDLSDHELQIMEALTRNGQLELSQVQEVGQVKNVFPLIKSLYQKGLVYTAEDVRERYRPKMKRLIRLAENFLIDDQLNQLFVQLEKRASRQSDALLAYLSLSPQKEAIDKSALTKLENIQSAAVKALIDKGILIEEEVRADRLDRYGNSTLDFELNVRQAQVKAEIDTYWNSGKSCVLLHGITGSGKSFVYFEQIREVLQNGGQALYLLPEIALTVQLVGKLRACFGDQVLISHSKFNENERVEVYQKVARGESVVVIGARSTLFLPFKKLDLILIDEEHDASYKQYDPAPRYQARDAAIYLANLMDARILLGSATPSVESYYNAKTGKYGLVELKERFGKASVPRIELIDLGEMRRKGLIKTSFSTPLLDSIKESVDEGHQAILFQNRKGYSPIIQCKNCGWSSRCISCDITLTYYKTNDTLRCNYCGYSRNPPKTCGACGSLHLEMSGFGTERIEEELALLQPQLRISRFDQDSTRGKHAHHRLVHEFEEGQVDVMVGTQMITKGLDFEKVDLVGVIQADQLLNFPHFRAYERAFQLLTQVAGRSGRREFAGKVLIQTYQPGHSVLQEVINHDYAGFYQSEIEEREKFLYPPFSRLIEVNLRHKEIPLLEEAASLMAARLRQFLGSRVLGPETPYVSRLRNYYIRRILIKLEKDQISPARVKPEILKIYQEIASEKSFRQLIVHFDVDPA